MADERYIAPPIKCRVCGDCQENIHILFEVLEESATSATCSLCCLLYQAANAIDIEDDLVKDAIYVTSHSEIKFSLCFEDGTQQESLFVIYLPKADPIVRATEGGFKNPWSCQPVFPGWTTIPEYPSIPENTGDGHAFQWLQARFASCTSEHVECNYETSPILPTRVLDLTVSKELRGPLKLLNTDADQRGTYAALSHCWGDPKGKLPVRTTSMTLPFHVNGFDLDYLPKTFQDAVITCRRLSIPYLWIDSLCIIQDSLEDWRSEAAKMAEVYGRSSITISATAGEHSHSGLFRQSTKNQQGQKFSFRTSDVDTDWQLFAREKLDHPSVLQKGHDPGFRPLPLLTRAWTFQERMLSPRIVHFSTAEIIWDCRHGLECQCSGQAVWSRKKDHYQNLKDGSERALQEEWADIATHFARTYITKPSDRLPALAGLAREFSNYTSNDDEYLAGLWKNRLLSDALWFPNRGGGNNSLRPKPLERRAPSWSWVNNDHLIWYTNNDRLWKWECKLVEAKCTPEGPDPFGENKTGELIVIGHLDQGSLIGTKSKDPGAGYQFTVRRDDKRLPDHYISMDYRWECTKENGWVAAKSKTHIKWKQPVFCIRWAKSPYNELQGSSEVQGIALVCVDEKTKTFERIGLSGWWSHDTRQKKVKIRII